MSPTVNLRDKIHNATAAVGVIGLGYVGLPLARAFRQAGFRGFGLDVDPKMVEQLNAGRNYLPHLGEDFVDQMAGTGRFKATVDAWEVIEAAKTKPLGFQANSRLAPAHTTGT